jgi:hydrogenase expression/formation protein HypC
MTPRLGAATSATSSHGGLPGGNETLCDHDSHCITCSDEAVPLRVVRIDEERELALCENEFGERTTVEIALVAPVALNAVVLVHAGTAIATGA